MCTQNTRTPPVDPERYLTREQLIQRNRQLAAQRAVAEHNSLVGYYLPTDPTGLHMGGITLARRARSYTTN